MGSPLYMAPEIVLGKPYDAKVDVWSLGCIVNIMLTGNAPFFGKTQNDIFKATVHKQPVFGKAKRVLSPSAINFINDCLQKDPYERLSAQELLDHPWLTRHIEDQEIDAEIMQEIFNDMKTFTQQNVFQTHVISYLRTMTLQAD